METKGLRFNEGKVRYDLLEPYAIEQLAKVFTKGAEKYAPFNWLKGMEWSKCLASLKRHLAAFEQGVDYDNESELLHMAHVAWNALALVSYYKYHPQYDDRLKSYNYTKRIGVDLDECIVDFTGGYSKVTNSPAKPVHWSYCSEMLNNFTKWKDEGSLDDFYTSLEPLLKSEEIGFEPICYITNRPVDSNISNAWLKLHGFPQTKVYTTKNSDEKVQVALAEKLDYFIDDNYETFIKMNKAGICCFLMDAAHNQKYEVGYRRIKSFADFKERFL